MTADPICSTCGTDFACFDGAVQTADAHGWYSCRRRCPLCDGSLRVGATMEHPGLGAVIHLGCSPTPEETELDVFA
ncbi:MAG: hypothetical protein H6528_13810 [Actinobacteria bacterium]|nr:hypothetical protein [Actinomycetota bacterium]MCB8998357.1 hypothetical protein [Actinomycetota bacterium]HPJ20327.1 hypothetical protein [Actinomycetota bacterium]HRY10924.1 hypothetical protein [Candidatus Nanopelagicales bacterium]